MLTPVMPEVLETTAFQLSKWNVLEMDYLTN
jgi:hypothetical protein